VFAIKRNNSRQKIKGEHQGKHYQKHYDANEPRRNTFHIFYLLLSDLTNVDLLQVRNYAVNPHTLPHQCAMDQPVPNSIQHHLLKGANVIQAQHFATVVTSSQ
jgi:hypothetical protein